jgi:hypothetical protein
VLPTIWPTVTSTPPERLCQHTYTGPLPSQTVTRLGAGREEALEITRVEEQGSRAQRKVLLVQRAKEEKNTGRVRSLASQKATTCCPLAIVAEGRSATFLHVLCIVHHIRLLGVI